MRYQRIFTIVLDSLGIGAMEDSPEYGDVGVDTLGHIAACRGHLQIPNLKRLGIANLKALHGVEPVESPGSLYAAAGKKLWKRYYDRSLGDDGTLCDETFSDLYRDGISQRTHRRTGEAYRQNHYRK